MKVLSGEVPWSEVAAEHIIIQKLTDGQIPRRPSTVSRTHWKFIRKCWLPSHRNSTRPSASEIVDYLNNTQIHGKKYIASVADNILNWHFSVAQSRFDLASYHSILGSLDYRTNS
jgi:hypothetical protein